MGDDVAATSTAQCLVPSFERICRVCAQQPQQNAQHVGGREVDLVDEDDTCGVSEEAGEIGRDSGGAVSAKRRSERRGGRLPPLAQTNRSRFKGGMPLWWLEAGWRQCSSAAQLATDQTKWSQDQGCMHTSDRHKIVRMHASLILLRWSRDTEIPAHHVQRSQFTMYRALLRVENKVHARLVVRAKVLP